jgi:hypothetical protein
LVTRQPASAARQVASAISWRRLLVETKYSDVGQ